MSRLVLISNKQCDGKDLACAGQTLAADAEPGLWLGWNGDVQNFAQRPISCRQRAGYDQVTFRCRSRSFAATIRAITTTACGRCSTTSRRRRISRRKTTAPTGS